MVDPLIYLSFQRLRCSSVVRAFAHVRWVVGSILHGGPTDLSLVPKIEMQLRGKSVRSCEMGRRIDPLWWTIELSLAPASAPRLVLQRLWYVLFCLWDGAYKTTLAGNWKE